MKTSLITALVLVASVAFANNHEKKATHSKTKDKATAAAKLKEKGMAKPADATMAPAAGGAAAAPAATTPEAPKAH